MTDPLEETGGHAANPPQDQEASTIQKDVKENGELPASETLTEIGGKEKQDPTLNDSAAPKEGPDSPAADESTESPFPSGEGKESWNGDEPSSIMDGFLSLVGLGPKSETEKEESHPAEGEAPTSEEAEKEGVPQAEEKAPTSEETEKQEEQPAEGDSPQPERELPGEGIFAADEPWVAEPAGTTPTAEESAPKAPSKENAEAGGETESLAEDTPKSPDSTETNEKLESGETIPEHAETTETGELTTGAAERGIPQPDEPESKVGEAEAPKSTEGEEATPPKADEKTSTAEEPSVGALAETTKIDESGEADAAEEGIPKTLRSTGTDEAPLVADESPKPNEADGLKAAEGVGVGAEEGGVVDKTDTPESVTKEEDSSTGGEEAEEAKLEEGTPQEPTGKAEEQEKPKSFFGVVLKPVASNAKSSLESAEGEDNINPVNVGESPEDAHEDEPASHLTGGTVEGGDTGHTPLSDVSPEKEAGQTEVEEAPKEDSESETLSKEVNPLTEVSGGPESPGSATPETLESVEQGESVEQDNAGASSREIGVKSSEVQNREFPAPEMVKETPESAPEEAVQETVEGAAGGVEEPKNPAATPTTDEKPAVEGEESREIPVDPSPEPTSTVAAEEPQQDPKFQNMDEPEAAPIPAAEDTDDRLTEVASKEAKLEEGVGEKDDAGEEKPAEEEQGPALEKQPSLSVYIPKQEEAAAADGETPEENGLTTPRGTPLMQRVEQLEEKLAQLDSRQSPRSDFHSREQRTLRSDFPSTGQTTPRSGIDRPFKHSTRYVLEETGSKGTLLDRVAALEQKLAYFTSYPSSPSNGQATGQVGTGAEDSSTESISKPAESQTREWSPSGAEGDKAPEPVNAEEGYKAAADPIKSEQVNSEEGSKGAGGPVKPSTEEKSLPVSEQPETKGVAPARSNSVQERKIKAKAAVGKLTGIFGGCFAPKKGGTTA